MKSELSPRSHRLLLLDADSVVTTKSVKRRRRDSSVLGGNEQQGDVSEIEKPLSGQSTATTVKRSSRFRGVSRHVILMMFINILFCFFFSFIVSSVTPTLVIEGLLFVV